MKKNRTNEKKIINILFNKNYNLLIKDYVKEKIKIYNK